MIKIQAIGNIGKDAVSQTIGQNVYAKFSLAVRDGKDQQGNYRTFWIDCLKSDKEGKLVQYLTSGKTIFVEGKANANVYTNKEGKAVAGLSVLVNELEFVASPKPKEAKEAPKQAVESNNSNFESNNSNDMPDWLK